MRLRVEEVHEDPELQLRDGLDMDRIKAMAEYEEQGGKLPAITVVGDDNLLADGHHRLYLAITTGRLDIDAERLPGNKPEAVALAIQLNDLATSKPLTRSERNKGIKVLLQAGWTQERIATATGVHQRTIGNIANALAMRGGLTKRGASGKGGPTPKPVAVLPESVHEKLGDTVLVRIAELPVEQQAEFAAAVAAVPNKKDATHTGLSEPRIREAVKAVRAGASIADAVQEATPSYSAVPKTLPDVAHQVRRRLERFTEPMTVEGVERDIWQVLAVLVANIDAIPLEARSLSTLLDDISIQTEFYSQALRGGVIEVAS